MYFNSCILKVRNKESLSNFQRVKQLLHNQAQLKASCQISFQEALGSQTDQIARWTMNQRIT